MSWNFAKYLFISSLIVCILSVAAMDNPLDPNTQNPPQKANPIKEAIMKLIQNGEFLPDEHDIDYYTQTIKESLKSNITPEDVYQAFKGLRADISKKSADISEEDPNAPKYSKEAADISKENRAKNRELSKKINTWLNQNQPNQRLRKVVDTMYQDHVVTAEFFNDNTQKGKWQSLMTEIFNKTFQNSICEVHYLNLDTQMPEHIDKGGDSIGVRKDLALGKGYAFHNVNPNRIISLVIYRPKEAGKVPVGIFNHGGGANNLFYPGQSNPILTALGGLGYAIVAPNYRNGSLKEHLEDMQVTTKYLQSLEFVDKNKIVLTGISTGTLLNSLVIDQVGSELAGVFLHTGFYGDPDPSPFDHLMNIPSNLPIFLASGAKDPYESARPNWVIKYVRALQGVPPHNVSFFLLEQGGHQLIELIHPEIPSSVLSGDATVDFANLKKIIKESEKRYNTDEMMDYISHLVEFLDKIAHGEIPSPVHSELDPAYQYKKIGISKWERAQEPRQELTNEEINHQKEQVAKPIIAKAQAAQSVKGIKTPEALIQAYFQSPIDLLPKNPLLKSAPYTLSLAQLKVLLEDEYDENDLEKNVTLFLAKYDTEKKSIGDRFIKGNQLKTKNKEEEFRKRLREDTAENKEYNSQILTSIQGILEDEKKRELQWERLVSEKISENQELKSLILKIIKKEIDYKGAYVLYHATNSKVGFLYDVWSALCRLLTLQANPKNQEEYVRRLRLLDDAFSDLFSASDLLEKTRRLEKKYPEKIFNYLPGYKDVGLSAQWFLFGSYKYWTSSTFFNFFCESETASDVSINDTLKSFFTAIGLKDEKELKDIIDQFVRIYDTSINKKDARLLQIFISPDIIGEMTYVSEVQGYPLDLDKFNGSPLTHSPSQIMPNSVQDPMDFERFLAKNRPYFKYQTGDEREEFSQNNSDFRYINSLESRFFMKPAYMDDPTKIQIISYHLIEPTSDYTKEIEEAAAKSLTTWLIAQPKLGAAMTRHKPPLVKLQEYVVQGMIEKKPSPQSKRPAFTLYDLLSEGKRSDAEQWVKDHKTDIEAKIDEEGHPLLYQLLLDHKFEAAEWLVTKGARLNGTDSKGNAIIFDLIEQNQREAVDWLRQHEVTPLSAAISTNDFKRAKLLIDEKIDPNDVNKFSLLIFAAYLNQFDFAESLLKKGVITDVDGALKATIEYSFNDPSDANIKLAKLLLENGANPNVQNSSGETPLMIVCMRGKVMVDFAKLLLGNNADPNIPDKDGFTPLMVIADPALATLLLEHGANLHAADKKGTSVLKNAIRDPNLMEVFLSYNLKHNPDRNQGDLNQIYNGKTLLNTAVDNKDADIVDLLIKYGAEPNQESTVFLSTHEKALEFLRELEQGGAVLSPIMQSGVLVVATTLKDELKNVLITILEKTPDLSLTGAHAALEHYIKVRNEIDTAGLISRQRFKAFQALRKNPQWELDQIKKALESSQ